MFTPFSETAIGAVESICHYFTVYIWPNADTITNWYCFGQKRVLFRVENSTGTSGDEKDYSWQSSAVILHFHNSANLAGAVPVGVKLGKKTFNIS